MGMGYHLPPQRVPFTKAEKRRFKVGRIFDVDSYDYADAGEGAEVLAGVL